MGPISPLGSYKRLTDLLNPPQVGVNSGCYSKVSLSLDFWIASLVLTRQKPRKILEKSRNLLGFCPFVKKKHCKVIDELLLFFSYVEITICKYLSRIGTWYRIGPGCIVLITVCGGNCGSCRWRPIQDLTKLLVLFSRYPFVWSYAWNENISFIVKIAMLIHLTWTTT